MEKRVAVGEIGVAGESAPGKVLRPELVEAFLRGCAFPGGGGASYPRADPRDRDRLPGDTWGTATIPVGVRLELVGDAEAIEISYVTQTDDLGYRGSGAGTSFSLWRGGVLVDEAPAALGEGITRLDFGAAPAGPLDTDSSASDLLGIPSESVQPHRGPGHDDRRIVYLPEGMKPSVLSVSAVRGSVAPAPLQPRWIVYGDSIAEGWTASCPAAAWPAVAGRAFGLDVVNLGYAGAARGEMVSAEQIAGLGRSAVDKSTRLAKTVPGGARGDLALKPSLQRPVVAISISHGTNCWTRVPHSTGMIAEGMAAFLDIVRQGHPGVPIVVISPVVRPEAEVTENRLGATLAALRGAIESAVLARIAGGDKNVRLLPGGLMIGPEHLADGIHPNDEGHQLIAEAIGSAVADAVGAL